MKQFAYDHDPIPFNFRQSVERFHVEELPLYLPSGKGNYLFLDIKKQDISTWRMLNVIKEATGADDREIGYAGLKDKSATAIQTISLPKKYEELLKNITTERIEIRTKSYNHSPLKIGQHKGNKFTIILTDITEKDAKIFLSVGKEIEQDGIPNRFGYQRFGEDGKSWQQGREIAHSGKRLKGAKEKLLVSGYQSYLFNRWLEMRLKISKVITQSNTDIAAKELDYPLALITALAKQPQLFKIFLGESMMDYSYDKSHHCRDMQQGALRFQQQKISPTGLLCGERATRSESDAYHLEAPYDDEELTALRGDRRFAWIWPSDLHGSFDVQSRQLTINFSLPKGSYATTLLEEIGKQELRPTL